MSSGLWSRRKQNTSAGLLRARPQSENRSTGDDNDLIRASTAWWRENPEYISVYVQTHLEIQNLTRTVDEIIVNITAEETSVSAEFTEWSVKS